MGLLTAEDVYGPRARNIPATQGALWGPTLFWSLPTPRPDLSQALPAPGELLHVYANHGRWLVSCPDCNGSQLACRTDPRFICSDCGNVAVEGRWRRLAWPANPKNIEDLLERRPMANRNWFPHESINDLREQNLLHGLGDPVNTDTISIDIDLPPFPNTGGDPDVQPPLGP